MANKLSVMTNVLRNVVSKQRIRYKEKGFNLDLTYVCDNIIAMGYPAEKYESMYRNRLEDVYKFLEENHRDHYKIYNLCLERSYDIKKFHGRVSIYPFEDHNPPTIELIQKFCEDVDEWLKADSLNVAAVHCKAGKGRTGTMICCYLLYSGQQRSAEDALACYDEKRTKDRKGVTIPSQRRYVQYFSKLIRLGLPYERRILQFCEIRFSEAHLLHSQGTAHCSISVLQDTTSAVKVQQLQSLSIDFRKTYILDMKNPALPVAGDIKVELTKNNKKIFHFWFNTFFVTDSSVMEGEGNDIKLVYTLRKWEIDDAHKDKENKCFSEDFKVELVFYFDDNNFGRNQMNTNHLTTNHRPTSHNSAVRVSQTNNYILPQNSSSGSEMNYMCDHKSSSSASMSSSLGGCGNNSGIIIGKDGSNGFETANRQLRNSSSSEIKQLQQLNSQYAGSEKTINVTTAAPSPQSLGYMDEQHNNRRQHHNYRHKQHQPQMQYVVKEPLTITSTPKQKHDQCKRMVTSVEGEILRLPPVPVASHGSEHNMIIGDSHPRPSSHCDSPSLVATTNHSNSSNLMNSSYNNSKTSSVSSQSSSSTNGDNEEDWESGESSAKPLVHNSFLSSTSLYTFTKTPFSPAIYPFTHQTASPSGNQPTYSSVLTYSTSSSRCKQNRVVYGDNNNFKHDDNDDDRMKLNEHNAKFVVLPFSSSAAFMSTISTNTTVESSCGSNTVGSSRHAGKSVFSGTRPKLIHLLMAPKYLRQPPRKLILKRKASYKLLNGPAINNATNNGESTVKHAANGLNCATSSNASSSENASAVNTKQKLKFQLKRNKLKLSQKFQWFQNYFRTDPIDFCQNFVQQTTATATTAMRRNSVSSTVSCTHKLSTTASPSMTPPPSSTLVQQYTNNKENPYERLSRNASMSISLVSIPTAYLSEDYYSSICDTQLSFNNSPCKSPRSLVDIALSSVANGGGDRRDSYNFSNSLTRSRDGVLKPHRERRATVTGTVPPSNIRRNMVIVAAKPIATNAIGFNVNNVDINETQSLVEAIQSKDEVDISQPTSINRTPSCDNEIQRQNIPFVFPQMQQELSMILDDEPCMQTRPPQKYSVNMVIVKETKDDVNVTKSVQVTKANESITEAENCDRTNFNADEIEHTNYTEFDTKLYYCSMGLDTGANLPPVLRRHSISSKFVKRENHLKTTGSEMQSISQTANEKDGQV
uniref:Phosphatidylinositol 3,4,5-trisphosphate 3-phosphatase and dual-specificity protein phosphatase PTEN n=1 Tax=Glossina pallidipes TaxID=7398 RepID=A0A1B0AH81_GLOPL